jgi:hypothetical protein
VSLPTNVIDRLFARLAATYGAAWDRSLGQTPIADVKTLWAHELQGFAPHLDAIAWALEHLPERCPNVIEFRNLCRRAPEQDVPRLPEPAVDPERIRAELAKLGGMRHQILRRGSGVDIDWARAIVARKDCGARIAPLVLKMARDAIDRRERVTSPEAKAS